jgi:hypothetical protein
MRLLRVFGLRLSSDRFDAGMGELACWGVSILVLVLGFLKLASLPLTETELFFGLMLVFAVALLGWNLGMLVRIDSNTRQQNRE